MSSIKRSSTASGLATESGKKAKKVDDKYNNESAHLVIISSNGVRFYVQKFHLQAASSVFRTMIESCTGDSPELSLTDGTIERSATIRRFLDLMCDADFDLDDLEVEDVLDLIKLCDKYDCAKPRQTLKLLIMRPVRDSAGAFVTIRRFFLACIIDDVESACRFLVPAAETTWGVSGDGEGPVVAIVDKSCLDLTAMPIPWVDLLPHKYFHALLRASRLRLTFPPAEWEAVAEDFKEQVKAQERRKSPESTPV